MHLNLFLMVINTNQILNVSIFVLIAFIFVRNGNGYKSDITPTSYAGGRFEVNLTELARNRDGSAPCSMWGMNRHTKPNRLA